ncbi:MAG: hypothetical protein M0015_00480 [Betaproteobacteria bacterium]|nr:hypothetical protein [Betaproteobacteria bacterium]
MRIPTVIGWPLAATLVVLLCAAPGARASAQDGAAAQDTAQVATVAQDCLAGFAAPIFDPLRGKLAPRAQDVSDAMLALKSEPSQQERGALLVWVQLVTTCRENVLATAEQVVGPDEVAALDLAWQSEIAKLRALRSGAISYGEYAAWLKRSASGADAWPRSLNGDEPPAAGGGPSDAVR